MLWNYELNYSTAHYYQWTALAQKEFYLIVDLTYDCFNACSFRLQRRVLFLISRSLIPLDFVNLNSCFRISCSLNLFGNLFRSDVLAVDADLVKKVFL